MTSTNTALNQQIATYLKSALILLKENGWCKHTFDNQEGNHCLMGAFILATGASIDTGDKDFSCALGCCGRQETRAMVNVVNELSHKYNDMDAPRFNDLEGTTFEDIEAFINKAIEDLSNERL